MVLSGDLPSLVGFGESGDPGLITAAVAGARGIGRIFRRRGGTAITRTGRTLAMRPVTTAIAGGAAAGVAGGALEALLAGAGGAAIGGMPGGFTVLRVSRTGRPIKILTPQGRVISLTRRRGGISAAAIRGAFKLARLAHAFGGVARTGRRTRRPLRSR